MKKVWKWLLLALCTACALCAFAACKKDDAAVTHQHTFAHYIEREATCTQKGVKEHLECLICNKAFSTQTREELTARDLEIACVPHTEVEIKAVEPTCATNGRTMGKHCSVCNTVFIAQEVIPSTGHNEVIDEAVAVTCTTDGKTAGKHCSVCDTVFVVQEVISATGHTEVIDEAEEATCTKDGKTAGKHCSTCNTVFTPQEVIPAKGWHELNEDSVCVLCGKSFNYTFGLDYELNEDGNSYSVSGIGRASGDIVIPAVYEGKPVTAIRGSAFSFKDITSVTIPDSVEFIGRDRKSVV